MNTRYVIKLLSRAGLINYSKATLPYFVCHQSGLYRITYHMGVE